MLWIGSDGKLHLKQCDFEKRYQVIGVPLPLPFVQANRCSDCGESHHYDSVHKRYYVRKGMGL